MRLVKTIRLAAWGLAGLTGWMALSGAAGAATLALTSTVQISGTAPFDAAGGPGKDVSASDQVVRTNDDITYFIEMNASSAVAANYKITLPNCDTAPNVGAPGCSPGKVLANWTVLPPQCSGAGSGISANKQVLTCVRSDAGATSILPIARVDSHKR